MAYRWSSPAEDWTLLVRTLALLDILELELLFVKPRTRQVPGKLPGGDVADAVVIAPGSADMIARAVAQKLAAALGQPWIVDNRAGGSGQIGMPVVAFHPAQARGIIGLVCAVGHGNLAFGKSAHAAS